MIAGAPLNKADDSPYVLKECEKCNQKRPIALGSTICKECQRG